MSNPSSVDAELSHNYNRSTNMADIDPTIGPLRPRGRSYKSAWEQGYKGKEIHGPLKRVTRSLGHVLSTYNDKVRRNLDVKERHLYQKHIVKWLLHIEREVFPAIRKEISKFDCPRHWDPSKRKWVPTTEADKRKWREQSDIAAEAHRRYREQRIFERAEASADDKPVKFDVKRVGRDTEIAKRVHSTIIGPTKGSSNAQTRKKQPR